MSNNEKGMEELINYVTKMGHRKIAFIQGNRSAVAERRLAGFYKACMTRGISVEPDWILNGDYHNPDLTYKLTKELLSRENRPAFSCPMIIQQWELLMQSRKWVFQYRRISR